uniref:Mitochondrial carrier protein n=1 Tax=Arcella intermedia TaxID=1963864 RepID=A0A6B2LCJ4_9EUKA
MQISGAVQCESRHAYSGMLFTFARILKEEGLRALYKGLAPALLRQLSYGSLRIGLYEPLKALFTFSPKHELPAPVPIWQKMLAGASSGAIAAAICNPTDVLKIRMQAEYYFHVHYKSMYHAVKCILSTEGWKGLYKGWIPTTQRAAVVAVTELCTYDEVKQHLVTKKRCEDTTSTHLIASLITGWVSTFFSSPMDFVKTRLQGQPVGVDGKGLAYRGMVHCFVSSVRNEGVFSLWKGVWPHYLRRGPHLVITFISIEKLRNLFNQF